MRSRNIAGLVLALGLFSVSAAVAQQPARRDSATHRNHNKHEWQGRGRQGGGMGMLLKGIDLTADQKAQLKSFRSQGEKQGGQNFDREALKTARERQDTAALRQFRVKRAAEMKTRRQEQITQIRAILTPAQQTIFDRNVIEAQKRFDKNGQRGEGRQRHQG